MGRALFLHHYLPAVHFAFLVTASIFDFLLRYERKWLKCLVASALVVIFAASFYHFAPFVYGLPLTPEQVMQRRWLPSWDFHYITR